MLPKLHSAQARIGGAITFLQSFGDHVVIGAMLSQLWHAGAPGQVIYVPGPPGPPGAPGNATATASASAVAIVEGTTVVNGLRTSGVGVLTDAEANRTGLLPQQVPVPSPPPPPASIMTPPPPPPPQCLVE